jgi:hypothetical protein
MVRGTSGCRWGVTRSCAANQALKRSATSPPPAQHGPNQPGEHAVGGPAPKGTDPTAHGTTAVIALPPSGA